MTASAEALLPCLFKTTQYGGNKSAIAKKAETLFMNLSNLIDRVGIERVGFHTLTFKENLVDQIEAQRRWNNYACNFLRKEVSEHICAVERQKRGAIHFHVVASFPGDIRTGFDFEAARCASDARKRADYGAQREFERLYFASANDNLREFWRKVGNTRNPGAADAHGFGRCETLPVLSNSAAISRYVGAYVGSEWSNRRPMDRGMRTIRYSLLERKASIRWAWANGNGPVWRRGCSVLGAIFQTDDLKSALGSRWAWNWRKEISAFGRHYDRVFSWLERNVSDNLDRGGATALASRMAEVILQHEAEKARALGC